MRNSITRLTEVCDRLITDAQEVLGSEFDTRAIGAPTFVDVQLLNRWWGRVRSFGHQLGSAAAPWRDALTTDPERNTLVFTKSVLGTLEAIKHELEHGYLDTFTQLVRAETLADLLDQGDHLLGAGYYLAAGVIGRAVLEEHLRTTCEQLGETPEKKRPTINDFNQALYKANHYSKTRMKQIDGLASVGNDAAHNDPGLQLEDVKRLLGRRAPRCAGRHRRVGRAVR